MVAIYIFFYWHQISKAFKILESVQTLNDKFPAKTYIEYPKHLKFSECTDPRQQISSKNIDK